MQNKTEYLLTTKNLKKYFSVSRGINPFSRSGGLYVKAVDDISINFSYKKTTAIVGESGCGKTTLIKMIAQLIPSTSGAIFFEGKHIQYNKINRKELYRKIQVVFQDSDSSLDPRMTVGNSISEPIRGLIGGSNDQIRERMLACLESVGLSTDAACRFPKQLSGGQRQRVTIARAMAPSPKLIILDEPTSGLDVSMQAQILQLLVVLQEKLGLSFILVTHNVTVAQYLADTIAVMYAGQIVEYGPSKVVLHSPGHPYTISLMNCVPACNPMEKNLLKVKLTSEVPSAINPPSGCKFNPRCAYAADVCRKTIPNSQESAQNHFISCHFIGKIF